MSTTKFPRLVVLTGAGISAESGLRTFRGNDGMWEHENIEDVCTPEGYYRDKKRVKDFYNFLRKGLKEHEPNAAHFALDPMPHTSPWPNWNSVWAMIFCW